MDDCSVTRDKEPVNTNESNKEHQGSNDTPTNKKPGNQNNNQIVTLISILKQFIINICKDLFSFFDTKQQHVIHKDSLLEKNGEGTNISTMTSSANSGEFDSLPSIFTGNKEAKEIRNKKNCGAAAEKRTISPSANSYPPSQT